MDSKGVTEYSVGADKFCGLEHCQTKSYSIPVKTDLTIAELSPFQSLEKREWARRNSQSS